MSGQAKNLKKSKSVQSAKAHIGTKKEKLTQKELKKVIKYDPDTGIFIWIKSRKLSIKPGTVAGSAHIEGYISINVNGGRHLAHRLAYLYMEGYFPENDTDHIDRNRKNNKWSNLREVSRSCNTKNSANRKNNTSGITGVSFDKQYGKWNSYITRHNGRRKFIGYYPDLFQAAVARYNAELSLGYNRCDSMSSAYKHIINNWGDTKWMLCNETK
jgi:hypothetical protein